MNDDKLINVEHAAKKYCRSLKRSLWYGICDISQEFLGRDGSYSELRQREFWAVNNISFEVHRGECVGLLGRNGAGKSTVLKMLHGLAKPDRGKITIRGRIGALIELGTGFNPILTGRENIYNNAAVLGMSKTEVNSQLDAIIDFAGIGDALDTPVRSYSSGMKVRLGFAVAAQLNPDVLLIDEVLAVGDTEFRMKCMNRISQILPSTSIVFVSHNLPHISRICNRVIVLDQQRILTDTTDVAQGIDTYHQLADTIAREDVVLGAELADIRLRADSVPTWISDSVCQVQYGDDLQIQLKLNISSEVNHFDVRIVVSCQELPLLDCFSGMEHPPMLNHQSGHEQINIRIPQVQLNSGHHAVTIIVRDTDRNNSILCRAANAAYFRVQSPFTSWCKTIVEGEWTQQPVANLAAVQNVKREAEQN